MSKGLFTLPAFAKINWFLRVLGKREDGFHEICTVFQTVSLSDFLTFSDGYGLKMRCGRDDIPTDGSNLIIKAAEALKQRFNVTKGAYIQLEKHIPSPGGLGGGSSNAAVALIGLNKLWEINAVPADILEIASALGSDVPFFLQGGTACGTGRGSDIERVADLTENFLLLVTPNVAVSTSKAYTELRLANLTNKDPKSILKLCRNEAKTLDLRQSALINDFEDVIFTIYPEIEEVKKRLIDSGAVRALMSGSGASVFGIFDNEESRQKAIGILQGEKDWRLFPVRTISQAEYWDILMR